MAEDELKNRISMVLVNPVLKQGFETMYKEYTELKGEADKLLKNWCKGEEPCLFLKKRDGQLHKAKEIIENLTSILITINDGQVKGLKIVKEAEQFLNSKEVL